MRSSIDFLEVGKSSSDTSAFENLLHIDSMSGVEISARRFYCKIVVDSVFVSLSSEIDFISTDAIILFACRLGVPGYSEVLRIS
jgi:hypothetical protein